MSRIWQRGPEAMHPSASDIVNLTGTNQGLEAPSPEGDGQEGFVSEGRLSIATEFSVLPGGAESAREFLKQLVPLMAGNDRVVIDLDGVAALPASFLRHLFHALVTEHRVDPAKLADRVKLETTDPELEIYISMADKYARQEAELAAA